MLRPPLKEQQNIVDHIHKATGELDASITKTQRQIELVREYQTRLISDVVTGKLDVREAVTSLPEADDDEESPAEDEPSVYGMDVDLYDADVLEDQSAMKRGMTV